MVNAFYTARRLFFQRFCLLFFCFLFYFILFYIWVVKFILSRSLIFPMRILVLFTVDHSWFVPFRFNGVRPFYVPMQYLLHRSMACCLFVYLLAAAAVVFFCTRCLPQFLYGMISINFVSVGTIFIHAYVIKSHRICAESLWKYPNTTYYIITYYTMPKYTRRSHSQTHTRTHTRTHTVITFQI